LKPQEPLGDLFSTASGNEDGWQFYQADAAAAKSPLPRDEKLLQPALESRSDDSGHAHWKLNREEQKRKFEQQWAVPLGHRVRLTLVGDGPELEGLLLHDDDRPNKRRTGLCLRIGSHRFHSSEVASVVRLD